MSYHKNACDLYPSRWIEEYKKSILNQTYHPFDIFEVAYGDEPERLFDRSVYLHQGFETFNHVQNFLLDHLFAEGYDCVANSNVDDKYSPLWIEKMVEQIQRGYDLVSCNFCLFTEPTEPNGEHGYAHILNIHEFENVNIEKELAYDHNPICHPAVVYSKAFWDRGNRYNPEDVKTKNEDMRLWQRAIKNSRFKIVPENLCYHRFHKNSVCQSNNK